MIEEQLTGEITSHTHAYISSETDPVFAAWNKSTGISITKSQVSDFPTNITSFGSGSATLGQIPIANGSGGLLFTTPSLEDLSDVEWSGTKLNDQLLRFNSTTGKWYNWTPNFLTEVASGSIEYSQLSSKLNGRATVTSTVDFSAQGIGEITLSGNTTFSFSNLQTNKTLKLKVVNSGYTIEWPSYCHYITGSSNPSSETGTFYIYVDCWNSTASSENVLINAVTIQ
jgi:hypothetical protein